MSRILFVTVGGSPDPIIKAVESFKPKYTYFIVTDHKEYNKGSIETVIGDEYTDSDGKKRPTISKKLELRNDQFEAIIVESDNPFDVYEKVAPKVEEHLDHSDLVHLDCTGGTKSMSVGLAYINTEYPKTKLSIITGPRLNLVKVSSGMERVKRFSKNAVYIKRQIKSSEMLIAKRDYHAAYKVLDYLTTEGHIEDDADFDKLYFLSQGFDAWDKFQYENALQYIERYKNDEKIKPYNAVLKQLINIEKLVKPWRPGNKIPTPNGFILVYDLLYNAERKAEANSFDDAVSRLYRALEMYEQFAFFTNDPALNTSDLDVSLLPEDIRTAYTREEDKKVVIGLSTGYNLLARLDHPVGKVWTSHKNAILDALQFRNHSYFAHGFNPVTEEDYKTMKQVVWEFIYECDQAMKFRSTVHDYLQLPNKF